MAATMYTLPTALSEIFKFFLKSKNLKYFTDMRTELMALF